ncbi:hypothetical protein HPB48_019253 [Haemaphysalis longicornis]|uniref:Uncharacterized protein n=1 Tax=Haemaphysalis longicornis TaxID=44386 RepID=A0A9J6GQN0_HAELO|nr:hypothetical protein HPB48_019253 [Haemaphysalis longicornis]
MGLKAAYYRNVGRRPHVADSTPAFLKLLSHAQRKAFSPGMERLRPRAAARPRQHPQLAHSRCCGPREYVRHANDMIITGLRVAEDATLGRAINARKVGCRRGACALSCFFAMAGRRSAGFLFVAILDTFQVNRSEGSWPIMLMGGLVYLAGNFISPITLFLIGAQITSRGVPGRLGFKNGV